jgi:hypothetical protein
VGSTEDQVVLSFKRDVGIPERSTVRVLDYVNPQLAARILCFGLPLVGVAIFHQRALWIPLTGLIATIAYKLAFSGLKTDPV